MAKMISSISEILKGLSVKGVKEYGLWREWDRLVGQQVSRHCQPERVDNGILFLKVSSSVWMQQLQFMKSMIMEKVNSYTGGAIKDLRFRLGTIEKSRKGRRGDWKDIPLDQKTVSLIDKDLSSIGDLELKAAIKKVRIKEEKVKAWRRDPFLCR